VIFSDFRRPRLNVLLFIDKLLETTGQLELFDLDPESKLPTRPVARVAPQRNRIVIFDGIHGQPWPLRGNQSRRLLQWYYAAAEAEQLVSTTFHGIPCGPSCYDGVLSL